MYRDQKTQPNITAQDETEWTKIQRYGTKQKQTGTQLNGTGFGTRNRTKRNGTETYMSSADPERN